MKTGLVLEGGAMRGMFTAGVLDVLMEHGIVLDGAIGVSAGAVFGCNYKSHQIGRVIRYNTQYCNDKRYASFGNLLRTGNLYSEQFCYHTVPEKLDVFDTKAFAENPMDFFVVCTDVRTGDPIYHKCRTGDAEDIQWMQASASMPLAAKIVKIGHYQLLDGGIADSIPVRFFESIGYKRNLIVLTQPKGFVKKKNKMLPAIRARWPRQTAAITAQLEALNVLEKAGSHDLDALCRAFGDLLGAVFACREDIWAPTLQAMGRGLGGFIYLMDAYDDLPRDKRRGAYNPLRELSTHPDYEEEMLDIFELLLARCAQNFERLPCVEDADLLRNILYSGVWLKYNCKNAKRTGKPDAS